MAATAQWQWVDSQGRKIFSDRPPPPEISDKMIIKRPPGKEAVTTPPEGTPQEGETAPATPVAKPAKADTGSGVDKSLEARKKQAEQAEAAKRKEEETRLAKVRAENCASAKQAKATYDSGVRVSRTNAAGEREYLDDAARAKEINRIQGVLDTDCKP
jgi:hypothetical protein